ncbi:class I SAM-dependent methyltransferase [Candidatus Peregrinibacteria bacterium]|nr:class I SAM-dependent methyltransferase [Candidatus Peregrinibacteria bacterium]MBI3816336.1 class I SAM-dependent methyltransferase [Candidatus Peregrinibacteria bacterium]
MKKPPRLDDQYNEYVKDFYRKIEDYDWNTVADQRIGLESHLHRAREKRMKNLIQRYGRGERYLDVGCGTGLILRHLLPNTVGIDLNPRHLERARTYNPAAHFQIADAEQLPFEDACFSTVVCTEVLEHLVHPELAVAGIHRVLERGGRFIGSTPRSSLLWRFRFLSSTHYHNEPFHNEFATEELRSLLSPFRILLLTTGFFRSMFFFVGEKE